MSGNLDRMTSSWTSSGQWQPVTTTTKTRTRDSDIYRVGIYGWRKRCLYALIVALTLIIIVNLAMTIWILTVLDFNTSGMGALKIRRDGITVTGDSQFMRPVYVRKLRSAEGIPLMIESDRNVTINARSSNGGISSRLFLGQNQAQAICDRFEIVNKAGEKIFVTNNEEVAVKVENARILGKGGYTFEGAVQTNVIRPDSAKSLSIESPSKNLEIKADQDIEIFSRAGDIRAKAVKNIDIESTNGEVNFQAQNFFIRHLRGSSGDGHPQYQVCICKVDGRLFLTASRSRDGKDVDCRATEDICKK